MLAPEKRRRPEWRSQAHHVECGDLPLPLGDHPVLDTDALARDGIGPTRDVPRCVNTWRARFHEFIHSDALVDGKPSLFSEREARAHADSNPHQIGIERPATLEGHAFSFDCADGILEMEFHAMLFMQRADEIAELGPEHAFERTLLRRYDVNFDLASAQSSGGFEADETRTDDHRAFGRFGASDNGAAVGK